VDRLGLLSSKLNEAVEVKCRFESSPARLSAAVLAKLRTASDGFETTLMVSPHGRRDIEVGEYAIELTAVDGLGASGTVVVTD
jgi:hypothetical protein